MLLRDFDVVDGGRQLTEDYTVHAVGSGKSFVDFLLSPARRRPLIYVSRTRADTVVVDPALLARRLAGVAHVDLGVDHHVDRDVCRNLPPALRCDGGRVRVYLA